MRQLIPSLITSYNLAAMLGPNPVSQDELLPFRQATQIGVKVGADVYMFMESDVSQWSKHWDQRSPAAIDFLSLLSGPQIEEICCSIQAKLRDRGTFPVAVTSFIPEISTKVDGPQPFTDTTWGMAFVNLIRLACRLQDSQPTQVLQLVAGSVIDEIVIQKQSTGSRFIVNANDSESLINLVLKRLSECLDYASRSYGLNLERFRIALELEPGPLFLLRDRQTLVDFANAISNHQCSHVQRCVGFNLDIAHWWLCGDIQTENDLPNSVRNRIFHSHISGHSALGHFGDLNLTKLSERAKTDTIAKQQVESYIHWIQFLCDESKTPLASQYVSLEQEAAKKGENLVASIVTLRDWIEEAKLKILGKQI